jgi:hypothetical protein
MSHDIQASWAAAELARHFQLNPGDCFATAPATGLSVFASREGKTIWPFADGVIVLQDPTATYRIALEYKRPNEGTHGILTALGQSLAYINKGYNGAVAVLPREYGTHATPGLYTSTVLDTAVGRPNLGVFTYDDPDTTLPSPFMGKLRCERPLEVDAIPPVVAGAFASNTETQWMHVREGSSTPSAFFRFLQVAKSLPLTHTPEPTVHIPRGLQDAVSRLEPAADPLKYLSNSVSDDFRDKAWRHFWFNYILTHDVMEIWSATTPSYEVNTSPTSLEQFDGVTPMVMFASRRDSIKSTVVEKLNAGTITEDVAWEDFARNIRKRAHSYREDIDSGLEHMGMLDADGKPTDLGYRFIDLCERTNAPHAGVPKRMLGAAILKNGDMISLLHYTHRLSEELFRHAPLHFATGPRMNRLDKSEYRKWLENELANNLRVLHKVRARGGVSRSPLQAEITMLRKFDFASDFRISVGLEINWPVVQDALDFPLS